MSFDFNNISNQDNSILPEIAVSLKLTVTIKIFNDYLTYKKIKPLFDYFISEGWLIKEITYIQYYSYSYRIISKPLSNKERKEITDELLNSDENVNFNEIIFFKNVQVLSWKQLLKEFKFNDKILNKFHDYLKITQLDIIGGKNISINSLNLNIFEDIQYEVYLKYIHFDEVYEYIPKEIICLDNCIINTLYKVNSKVLSNAALKYIQCSIFNFGHVS